MVFQIELGEIAAEVIRKDIKNVHLSVYPPTGAVRIAAPSHMKLETIRVFGISKLDWIKRQRKKFLEQEREFEKEYIDRESHYVWGKRYLLKIEETQASQVILKHSRLVLQISKSTTTDKRRELLDAWYREILRCEATDSIRRWEQRLGVKSNKLFIQKMKTKWGGCNWQSKNIRLNTDLAKKPRELLDYIVLHELAHLIVPKHNDKFLMVMDEHMPKWRFYRSQLNSLPVSHEKWKE